MLGCYHLAPEWCDHHGSDINSRMKELRDVVEQGYFNTYLLHIGQYLLEGTKIVAENGGTVWIGPNRYNSERQTIEEYTEEIKYYLDLLTKAGLRDVVLGFWWDEPLWNGQSNDDFLAQCEANYKLGLRNFPVFALGEFSNHEGNLDVDPDTMGKLEPYAAKYLTDIGYDSYGVDVREGYKHPKEVVKEWQTVISPNITDGRSYYTEYKKILQNHVGHDANFWYFPCAFGVGIRNSLDNAGYATEDYCIGQLEFMSEDVLKEKYPGGVIIYNYYRFNYSGFSERMDIKDESGNYKYFPDEEKWEKYSDKLRELKRKFESIKVNPITKLDV
jgi:hypothetical protein